MNANSCSIVCAAILYGQVVQDGPGRAGRQVVLQVGRLRARLPEVELHVQPEHILERMKKNHGFLAVNILTRGNFSIYHCGNELFDRVWKWFQLCILKF